MGNLAIVTRSDDSIEWMTNLTHPHLKKFSKSCNADFVILDKDSDCNVGNGKTHYRILQLCDLFEFYDRIFYIDSDVLVMPTCPNLFQIVPKTQIGIIFEDKGSRAKDRHKRIAQGQKQFGDIGWKENYINIAISVFSRVHQPIFQKIDEQYYTGRGFADVLLGYQIKRYGFPIHELSYKFNHMTMFSEPWNGSPSRFDSHIIHYAGAGIFEKNKGLTREKQMKKDYAYVYP